MNEVYVVNNTIHINSEDEKIAEIIIRELKKYGIIIDIVYQGRCG